MAFAEHPREGVVKMEQVEWLVEADMREGGGRYRVRVAVAGAM
jgi:hypothetical protein